MCVLWKKIYEKYSSLVWVYGVKVWHNFDLSAQVELGAILLVKLNGTFCVEHIAQKCW